MKDRAIQAILNETRNGIGTTRAELLEKYFGEFNSINLDLAISQLSPLLDVEATKDGQTIRQKGARV